MDLITLVKVTFVRKVPNLSFTSDPTTMYTL